MSDPDSPAVLAYRVGQLEKTQAEGFRSVNEKLDSLARNFTTKAELLSAQKVADLEHKELKERISKLEGWNIWIIRGVVGLVLAAVGAAIFVN